MADRWRVGRTSGRTLYRDEVSVGRCDTREVAEEVCAGLNRANEQREPVPPSDEPSEQDLYAVTDRAELYRLGFARGRASRDPEVAELRVIIEGNTELISGQREEIERLARERDELKRKVFAQAKEITREARAARAADEKVAELRAEVERLRKLQDYVREYSHHCVAECKRAGLSGTVL